MSASSGPLAMTDRLLVPIENLANLLAAIAIFALMCLGVAQIVLRSIFNAPITGYIDLVELSMASMAFLGAAYCQRLGAHIRMELLIGTFRGRMLWIVESFGILVAMFIIGVLVFYGWDHFWRAYTLGDTTIDAEYPVWPSKLLVPIAFGLWWLRLGLQLAGSIRLALNPSLEPVGVVLMKDVAHQAKDEIEEIMGDDAEDRTSGDAK
ncbi:MAG: TRAP transporter small permease [Pseudomonadota bacterium]